MQEQHPYKITPEQGWSVMLPALDKAMPMERHSRRFVMVWWTAAAVTVAALIMLLVWVNVQPTLPDHSFSGNTAPHNKVENSDPAKAEGPEASPSASSLQAIPSTTEITGAYNTNEKEISSPPVNSKKKSKSYSSQNQIANQGNNENVKGILSNEEVMTQTSITEFTNRDGSTLKDAAEVQDADAVVVAIPNLKIKAFNISETDELELTNFQSTPVATRKRRLIVPTLSAGALAGYENGAGINAMAGVDINILPKLSFTAGAGYSSYQPEASLFNCCRDQGQGSALIRNDLAYHGIGDYLPAESVFNAVGSDLNSFIETIRQWNIQAGLSYDISRRIQLEGGLSLGFGASTRSSYPIVTFDNSAPSTSDPWLVSYDLDDYNVIRSSSAGFYAGISYALSKRFDLYLRVMHSFDHYLETEQYSFANPSSRSDYIRGINVGMRYNLQGP